MFKLLKLPSFGSRGTQEMLPSTSMSKEDVLAEPEVSEEYGTAYKPPPESLAEIPSSKGPAPPSIFVHEVNPFLESVDDPSPAVRPSAAHPSASRTDPFDLTSPIIPLDPHGFNDLGCIPELSDLLKDGPGDLDLGLPPLDALVISDLEHHSPSPKSEPPMPTDAQHPYYRYPGAYGNEESQGPYRSRRGGSDRPGSPVPRQGSPVPLPPGRDSFQDGQEGAAEIRRSGRAHKVQSYRELAYGQDASPRPGPQAGPSSLPSRRQSDDAREPMGGSGLLVGGSGSGRPRIGRGLDRSDSFYNDDDPEDGYVIEEEEGDDDDEDYGPGKKKRKQKRKTSPVPKRKSSPVPGRMETVSTGGSLSNSQEFTQPIVSDKPAGSTSMLKGVSRHRLTGKWEACLWAQRRQVYLGGFETEVTAGRAYDMAALLFKGPEAQTNFPKENYPEDFLEPLRTYTQEQFTAYLRANPPVLYSSTGKIM